MVFVYVILLLVLWLEVSSTPESHKCVSIFSSGTVHAFFPPKNLHFLAQLKSILEYNEVKSFHKYLVKFYNKYGF